MNIIKDLIYEHLDDHDLSKAIDYYNELLDSSFMLQCLLNAGVDNWSGYSYAMEGCYGEEK